MKGATVYFEIPWLDEDMRVYPLSPKAEKQESRSHLAGGQVLCPMCL